MNFLWNMLQEYLIPDPPSSSGRKREREEEDTEALNNNSTSSSSSSSSISNVALSAISPATLLVNPKTLKKPKNDASSTTIPTTTLTDESKLFFQNMTQLIVQALEKNSAEIKTSLRSQQSILVRDWNAPLTHKIFFLPSFETVFAIAKKQLNRPNATCLYWLPDGTIHSREKIIDQNSYDKFRVQVEGLAEVVLYTFTPDGDSESQSPLSLPRNAKILTPSFSKTSVSSRRSTADQQQFRQNVIARDGNNCVLCSYVGDQVQACHIVPKSSDPDMISKVGLQSVDDVRNGIMLCSNCHFYFDQHFWCVNERGKVEIANALLSYEDTETHFGHLRDTKLKLGGQTANKPFPALWKHQKILYDKKATKRYFQRNEYPYVCVKCSKRIRIKNVFDKHVETCSKTQKKGNRHTDRKGKSPVTARAVTRSNVGKILQFK